MVGLDDLSGPSNLNNSMKLFSTLAQIVLLVFKHWENWSLSWSSGFHSQRTSAQILFGTLWCSGALKKSANLAIKNLNYCKISDTGELEHLREIRGVEMSRSTCVPQTAQINAKSRGEKRCGQGKEEPASRSCDVSSLVLFKVSR